jgi:hypothetical protein
MPACEGFSSSILIYVDNITCEADTAREWDDSTDVVF